MSCLRAVRFRSPSCILTTNHYRIRSAPRCLSSIRANPIVHQLRPRELSLRLMVSTRQIQQPTATNISPKSTNNGPTLSSPVLLKGWTNDQFYLQIDTFPRKASCLPAGKSILYNDRRSVHLINCSGNLLFMERSRGRCGSDPRAERPSRHLQGIGSAGGRRRIQN